MLHSDQQGQIFHKGIPAFASRTKVFVLFCFQYILSSIINFIAVFYFTCLASYRSL